MDGRASPLAVAQQFDEPASSLVFADLIAAVDGLTARKTAIAERLSRAGDRRAVVADRRQARAFRGIDTLTALSLHLELGADWQRFETRAGARQRGSG